MITYSTVLVLICDECPESARFSGHRAREVVKVARTAGWYVKDNRALCVKHTKMGRDYRRDGLHRGGDTWNECKTHNL